MINKICSHCKKEFPATSENFHRNWSKKDGLDHRCKGCMREYDKQKDRSNYNINKENVKRMSRKSYEKYKEKKLERNKMQDKFFKENLGISYRGLHNFIERHKSKQEFCSICNVYKKIELASINHTYTRDPNDYIWLCRSCHSLFDKCMEVVII